MAYKQKRRAVPDITNKFEKDLILAVGSKGHVSSIGSSMYDVEYRGELFSIVDNDNEGMQIVKTFCSKKHCKRDLGVDYSDVMKMGEELDFNEEKTRDLGKCIIMDMNIALDDIEPKRIRNVFEQIIAANECLRDKVEAAKNGE